MQGKEIKGIIKPDTRESPWISAKDLPDYMGVSVSFIRTLRNNGSIRFYKLGRKMILYRKSEIDRYIERHRQF